MVREKECCGAADSETAVADVRVARLRDSHIHSADPIERELVISFEQYVSPSPVLNQ